MFVASGFAASMMPESAYAASTLPDFGAMNDSDLNLTLSILAIGSLAIIPGALYNFINNYEERFFMIFADMLGLVTQPYTQTQESYYRSDKLSIQKI